MGRFSFKRQHKWYMKLSDICTKGILVECKLMTMICLGEEPFSYGSNSMSSGRMKHVFFKMWKKVNMPWEQRADGDGERGNGEVNDVLEHVTDVLWTNGKRLQGFQQRMTLLNLHLKISFRLQNGKRIGRRQEWGQSGAGQRLGVANTQYSLQMVCSRIVYLNSM